MDLSVARQLLLGECTGNERLGEVELIRLHCGQAVLAISGRGCREIIDGFGPPQARVHRIHLGVDAGRLTRAWTACW